MKYTIFENSTGSDRVSCLHVDTKMSIKMFVFTQILDIEISLFLILVTYVF